MNFLEIVVDTNDGDYNTSVSPITDAELAAFKPLIQAIKEFKPYKVKLDDGFEWTHTHNCPQGEVLRTDLNEKSPAELYKDAASPEVIAQFLGCCDSYDFHTVKHVRVLEVSKLIDLI